MLEYGGSKVLECATLNAEELVAFSVIIEDLLNRLVLDEFIWAMDEEDSTRVLSISLSFDKTLVEFRIIRVEVGSRELESFCVDMIVVMFAVTNVGLICDKLVRLLVNIGLVVFKVVSVELITNGLE